MTNLRFDFRCSDLQAHTLYCYHDRPVSASWSNLALRKHSQLILLHSSVIACPTGISASKKLSLGKVLNTGTPVRLCRMMTNHVQINLVPWRLPLVGSSGEDVSSLPIQPCGEPARPPDCGPVSGQHSGCCPLAYCGTMAYSVMVLKLPRKGEQGDSSNEVGWERSWKDGETKSQTHCPLP